MESLYRVHIPRRGSYETINYMNLDMVYKIRDAHFFDSTKFESINNILINICEEVFMEAYNNGGKEAGAIVNFETSEYTICKAKYFNKLVLNDNKDAEEYKLLTKANNFSCMLIHTHNSESTFSVSDIISFLTDVKLGTLCVINSNCSIDILIKKNKNQDYTNILNNINNRFYWTDILNLDILKQLKENSILSRRVTI